MSLTYNFGNYMILFSGQRMTFMMWVWPTAACVMMLILVPKMAYKTVCM